MLQRGDGRWRCASHILAQQRLHTARKQLGSLRKSRDTLAASTGYMFRAPRIASLQTNTDDYDHTGAHPPHTCSAS